MNKGGFAQRNMGLVGIPVSKIGVGVNIDSTAYICKTNLVRIYAKTELTIQKTTIHEGVGITMPAGSVEYFAVEEGDVLNIQGSANISSIN